MDNVQEVHNFNSDLIANYDGSPSLYSLYDYHKQLTICNPLFLSRVHCQGQIVQSHAQKAIFSMKMYLF
jgi:hypothetical protein